MPKPTELETPPRAAGNSARRVRIILAVVFSLLVAVLGVVLHRLDIALVDTFDKHIGDLKILLGSSKAAQQRSDIAVVLITEDTLLEYESRSPLDRALIAELVRAIDLAGPKAIGLDLIFDRRTRHDKRLIDAVRAARAPVVLGHIDTRVAEIASRSLKIQAELLAAMGRPHGHLMLARKESLLQAPDSVVRYIAPPLEPQGSPTAAAQPGGTRSVTGLEMRGSEAFVDVLAREAGYKHRPANRIISWQRPPDARTPLYFTLELPEHKPEEVKPALEGLFQPSWREFIKDRVVLVGAAMIDRDQHTTPLSVLDRRQIAGVYVHAQALAQRIDGNRDIRGMSDWLTALVSACIALACFFAARHSGFNPHGFLYGFAGLVLVGLASLLSFWLFRLDFPSIALATAWALGGFGGFLSDWISERLGLAE